MLDPMTYWTSDEERYYGYGEVPAFQSCRAKIPMEKDREELKTRFMRALKVLSLEPFVHTSQAADRKARNSSSSDDGKEDDLDAKGNSTLPGTLSNLLCHQPVPDPLQNRMKWIGRRW